MVPLQIHQHGAKGSATTQREVVYPQMHHLVCRPCGKLHDSTQDTRPRGPNTETSTQARTQASAGGQANGFDFLTQSGGHTCPWLQKGGEPLASRFSVGSPRSYRRTCARAGSAGPDDPHMPHQQPFGYSGCECATFDTDRLGKLTHKRLKRPE